MDSRLQVSTQSRKHLRIMFDLGILGIFIALLSTGNSGGTVHMILGIVIVPLIILHLLFNKKWLQNTFKVVFSGKLVNKMKKMFILNLCLFISFMVLIISGIIMYTTNMSASFHMHIVHSLFSKIFIILGIWHIKLHRQFFVNHLKRKAPTHGYSLRNSITKEEGA